MKNQAKNNKHLGVSKTHTYVECSNLKAQGVMGSKRKHAI